MAFYDLSQTKVKDDLNQWAGRGHCEERASAEEQNGRTYCSAEPRTGAERKGDCNSKEN